MTEGYIAEEAAIFCQSVTGLDADVVAQVLDLRYDYLVGSGMITDVDGTKERSMYPQFFTNTPGTIDDELELQYCAFRSDIPITHIDAVLEADDDYMVKIGIATKK